MCENTFFFLLKIILDFNLSNTIKNYSEAYKRNYDKPAVITAPHQFLAARTHFVNFAVCFVFPQKISEHNKNARIIFTKLTIKNPVTSTSHILFIFC